MIERTIDDLGRIALPKEIRRELEIRENDILEIHTDGKTICIKKKINSQFDRIKTMSIDEMAEEITLKLFAHLNKYNVAIGNPIQELSAEDKAETVKEWKQWLESEVQE